MTALLFSVDLEDVRSGVTNGDCYPDRVPANTGRYLEFLARHTIRGTFFVVGDMARRHPDLVRRITAAGHEIACHSDQHVQLDRHTPVSFRDDLARNLEALDAAGASNVTGFRAPTFSLTERTRWAYDVMAELGLRYSSSVLPARNPLYGWSAFGRQPCKIDGGLWELPISLHRAPVPAVPLVGGVYFRVLPFSITRRAVRRCLRERQPVLTYLHPYDIDTAQARFMHPDLNGNRLYNRLMYVNRDKVLARLERLRALGPFQSYGDYVATLP